MCVCDVVCVCEREKDRYIYYMCMCTCVVCMCVYVYKGFLCIKHRNTPILAHTRLDVYNPYTPQATHIPQVALLLAFA